MTGSKIGGLIRAVVAPLVAFAVGKGWLVDNETGELLIVAIAAMGTAAWSIFDKRRR